MKSSAFFLRIAICFALSFVPISELEHPVYTARLLLRGRLPAPTNIVILNFKPQEFKRLRDSLGGTPALPGTDLRMDGLKELFLWDPQVFNDVFRKLSSLNPEAVLVTWYIPSEFIDSLNDAGPESFVRDRKILWSSHFDTEGNYLRPARSVRLRDDFGFNNLAPDTDGVIRQDHLWDGTHTSLARATQEFIQPESAIPKQKNFLINFTGPAGTISSCSLMEVISGKTAKPECQTLAGKVVLLSKETDSDTADATSSYRTPFGLMSRAEILANEINTLLNRQEIYFASWFERSLLTLALIVGAAFCIVYYPVILSAGAILTSTFVILGVFFQALFSFFHYYIPVANIAISLLFTYLVFTGYRLSFQENLQWRSLKRAQYLRELDQMKTNFLSLLSHDLKTPLAKIQAVVDRLRRERATPTELLDSLENSNSELKNYINSVLSLSKIEAKNVILQKKTNDINQTIDAVLKRLQPLAAQKNIELEKNLEPLFAAEFDDDLIRQVLSNLVDNAIKYSPSGSKVQIRSHEEEGQLWVDVQDFGPGIPKDQLPLMFRKFSRFLRPMTAQVKGTGLGLYLSKYFIELHGGTIRVKSEENKGTLFTFSLPV